MSWVVTFYKPGSPVGVQLVDWMILRAGLYQVKNPLMEVWDRGALDIQKADCKIKSYDPLFGCVEVADLTYRGNISLEAKFMSLYPMGVGYEAKLYQGGIVQGREIVPRLKFEVSNLKALDKGFTDMLHAKEPFVVEYKPKRGAKRILRGWFTMKGFLSKYVLSKANIELENHYENGKSMSWGKKRN